MSGDTAVPSVRKTTERIRSAAIRPMISGGSAGSFLSTPSNVLPVNSTPSVSERSVFSAS
jgi:hypothetical protein